MAREIKLRAWDKELGEWIDPNEFMVTGMGELFIDDSREWIKPADSDRIIVVEFTGLLDKNGKEIYEGDIISSSNEGSDGSDVWTNKEVGIANIVWMELGFYAKNIGDENFCWSLLDASSWYHINYIEIIGNIYENPELLKS